MKSENEIRHDLREIQHYYGNKEILDRAMEVTGRHIVLDTIEIYEKHIVNAPKRLQDVYNGLYIQAKAQKVLALEFKVTEKYIQILNKRLILYFQRVLE